MRNTFLLITLLILNYIGYSQLSGTYSISANGGDYPNIDSAITDLKNQGVIGAVTFEIYSGNYNEQISLDSISGVSLNNPLTITALAGDTVNWSYSSTISDNYIIRINKTPYVTISNINFTATNTDYTTIIDFMNNADNLTISSCSFESNTTYTGESQALIHCNQNTVGNEQNCDSSLINNCTFTGGAYGIYTRAYALSGRRMYNNKYINNTFKNQNKTGIYLLYNRQGNVEGNTISNFNANNNYYGISLSHSKNTNAISNTIKINSTNSVIGISTSNSKGNSANEILIYANNFISISASGSSKGISTVNGDYVNYLYNTIIMNNSSSSYTFYDSNLGGNDIKLYNNILVNNGGGYIYRAEDASNFIYVDNNIYYNNGGIVASLDGSNLYSLDSIHFNYGFDSLSIVLDPQLDSNGIVHACGTDSIAVYDSLILFDAEGIIRDVQIPHVGYLEYSLFTHVIDVKSSCNSYTWIDGNTYTNSNNSATFILTNSNGCDSIISLDLTIFPSYYDTLISTICSGDSIILGSQILKTTGTYTENFSSVNGCDSTVVLELNVLPLNSSVIIIGPDTVSITDTSIYKISDGNFANWSIVGGQIINGSGTDSITVVWDSLGLINLNAEVYDSFTCFPDSVTKQINVIDISTNLAPSNNSQLIIYPNPLNNNAIIILPNKGSYTYILQVFDMLGNKIKVVEGTTSNNIIFNKGNLNKGMYFIELISNNVIYKNRLIIR